MNDRLNNNGKNIVLLIKNLLNNTNELLTEPDYNKMYNLSKFHSIQNLFYYGIKKYIETNKESVNIELLKLLTKENKMAIGKCAIQEAEMDVLEKELSKRNINYMLLKGSVIKHLYPSIDMRSMADIDIYFDKTKHKEVKSMMKDLGYTTEAYLKGNHDCYLKDPFMNVEMHRDLMNECYEMSRYYNDYFHKLIQDKEKINKFTFSNEDYYIFMIAHAAKHFSNGGTGIRTVIDEYLYLDKYSTTLDFKYINEELDKLGIKKFENNLRKLSYYWFGDTVFTLDEVNLLEDMSYYIFNSGTYGTTIHSSLNDFIGNDTVQRLNSNKIKYIIRKAFPKYKTMCSRNPILKKLPILLPWFYFTRFLKAIFTKKENINNLLNNTKNITTTDIEKNKKIHDDIGV